MHLEQRLEFIDSLAPLPATTVRSFAAEQVRPPHDIEKPTGSVLKETINNFLEGVPADVIDDVNLCKLVMQNAATKLYPDEAQLADWYKYYLNGLSNIGWTNQGSVSKNITIKQIGITMEQVVLDLAMSLIGNQAKLLETVGKKVLDAVKKNPEAIKLLESNRVSGRQSKYDFAPVWADMNGQPHMLMSYISLDANESKTSFLFWKTTSQSTVLKTASAHIYLDNKTFADLRQPLRDKYLANAKKFIIDLPDL